MNETKDMDEAARALGLDEVVPELYRDMLQPAARKLGEGLATVAEAVKIALAPLEAQNSLPRQFDLWGGNHLIVPQ